MLLKTEGVVLRASAKTEGGLLIKAYTRASGMCYYSAKGAPGRKSGSASALFRPLSVLEMVSFSKQGRKTSYLREARQLFIAPDIYNNMEKSSIAFFLSEMLLHAIREEEENISLFDYIVSGIRSLNTISSGTANFHLVFLLRLTKYLGIHPAGTCSPGASVFDLKSGSFRSGHGGGEDLLGANESTQVWELLHSDYEGCAQIRMTREKRNLLLDAILKYYRYHLGLTAGIKSVDVLREVL